MANIDHLPHVPSIAMVDAGIIKNLAIIVATAQSTNHLTEPKRARETSAGCHPRPGGCLNVNDAGPTTGTDVNSAYSQQSSKQKMPCPDKNRSMLLKSSEAFTCHAFLEDLVLCG